MLLLQWIIPYTQEQMGYPPHDIPNAPSNNSSSSDLWWEGGGGISFLASSVLSRAYVLYVRTVVSWCWCLLVIMTTDHRVQLFRRGRECWQQVEQLSNLLTQHVDPSDWPDSSLIESHHSEIFTAHKTASYLRATIGWLLQFEQMPAGVSSRFTTALFAVDLNPKASAVGNYVSTTTITSLSLRSQLVTLF